MPTNLRIVNNNSHKIKLYYEWLFVQYDAGEAGDPRQQKACINRLVVKTGDFFVDDDMDVIF